MSQDILKINRMGQKKKKKIRKSPEILMPVAGKHTNMGGG